MLQATQGEMKAHNALFAPIQIGNVTVRNRLAVAPMTRVSATADGVPTERMASYYREFADGEFGLVISEGIYPEARYGQAYLKQPGLVTQEQIHGWRRVTDAVHRSGGIIFAQLMHAGALSQCLDATIAPSAVRPLGKKMPEYGGSGGFPVPRAMTRHDVEEVIESFAKAAVHARMAGFDGIEVHGANGYLIDQFLTTYTNQREDEYGGDVAARIRFGCQVIRAIRIALGEDVVVGVRLSQAKVNDFSYRWAGGARDAEIIFSAVRDAGASYIHIADEGRGWLESARMESGCTITEIARRVANIPVIANGGLHDPRVAERLILEGQADLVSLARGALANPDWPLRVLLGRSLCSFDPDMLHPSAAIENTDRWRSKKALSRPG